MGMPLCPGEPGIPKIGRPNGLRGAGGREDLQETSVLCVANLKKVLAACFQEPWEGKHLAIFSVVGHSLGAKAFHGHWPIASVGLVPASFQEG